MITCIFGAKVFIIKQACKVDFLSMAKEILTAVFFGLEACSL